VTEISRRQLAAYAVAVVLVVLIGGRALRAGDGAQALPAPDAGAFSATAPGPAGAATRPGGTTGAGGVEVTSGSERVVVHVAGAVRHPGVYALAGGARVQDALRKAGGGRSGADLDALNLAAKATDGQQILVARRVRASAAASGVTATAATGTGAATAAGAPGPAGAAAAVNVNTADATQLEALDGVGPAIAAKIIAWRTQNGPFRSADDLAQVAGIGPKKLEAMRAQVVT
jgi:competence protein ComEA